MAVIPTDTTFDTLLSSVITKFTAITGVGADNVIVGTLGSVKLTHEMPDRLYAIEILEARVDGEEYIDQRNIRANFGFEFRGHAYAAVTDRIDGTDMKNIESLGAAMKTQIFSFHDDDPTTVCAGFRYVNPDYSMNIMYQEHAKNINTALLFMSFKVDTADTTA